MARRSLEPKLAAQQNSTHKPRLQRGSPLKIWTQIQTQTQTAKGVYVLAIEVHGATRVGRLGLHRFDGLYLYVGSALGPGGLKRVERHRAVASGQNRTKRWHIDYLLALGELKGVFVLETGERLECALAQELEKRFEPAVRGFGSSDCRCETHLFRASGPWERLVLEAQARVRRRTVGRWSGGRASSTRR